MKKTLLAAALALSLAGSALAAQLPNVAILATGGTIAGTAGSATQVTGYKAGDLAIQTLIDAVPAIKDFANVSGEQIAKISSNNMSDEVLLKLAKRCNQLLADPKIDGIVTWHGHLGRNRLLPEFDSEEQEAGGACGRYASGHGHFR